MSVDTRPITILDGPMGTLLNARGIDTPAPLWSASAIESSPESIASIHREYVGAGATVHTTATFRTQFRTAGDRWKALTHRAVDLTRRSLPDDHRVAGSLAPLEDCYRPDLSPLDCRLEHLQMARELAAAGCDLILCETFSNPSEAIEACSAALETGLPVWLALTAGPSGDLMSPTKMAETAILAEREGVAAILVNCTPATITYRFVEKLADANLKIPMGAYANAGNTADQIGWKTANPQSVQRYVDCAKQWKSAGATIFGGCCGTGPEHLKALSQLTQ